MTISSKKLLLASNSPYKKELLERLKIPFTCETPLFDEDNFKNKTLPPKDLALFLAKNKALSLQDIHPEKIIIGCDQIATIDGEILSKPGNHECAVKQLFKLQGKTHQLLTAVSVYSNKKSEHFLETTTLKMRHLTKAEIDSYLLTDKPYFCAGSYMLEKKGIALFESIKTDDYTAIIGLPLIKLSTILINQGIKLF